MSGLPPDPDRPPDSVQEPNAPATDPAEHPLVDHSLADDPSVEADRLEQALRVAEALVFSSASPVSGAALSRVLPEGSDADSVVAALRARYAGRGVELVEIGGGVQFRTALDLAPLLRRVIEAPRRLPRVAMETLAIVAYHQPVTRPEIEDIRGASLSQQTLDTLLEANLITPMGRRDSPGRPTLWGTTPQFLTQFGLKDIRDLPRRDDLLVEPPQASGSAGSRDGSAGTTAVDPAHASPSTGENAPEAGRAAAAQPGEPADASNEDAPRPGA